MNSSHGTLFREWVAKGIQGQRGRDCPPVEVDATEMEETRRG